MKIYRHLYHDLLTPVKGNPYNLFLGDDIISCGLPHQIFLIRDEIAPLVLLPRTDSMPAPARHAGVFSPATEQVTLGEKSYFDIAKHLQIKFAC